MHESWVSFSPLPLSLHSFCLLSSQLSRRTRAERLVRRLRKRLQNAFSLFTLKQNGPPSSVEANLVPRAFPWKRPFPAPPNFLREKHWGRGCAAALEAGAGKKENRKLAGHDGKGIEKEEGEPIPSSHRAPRAFYFSMYCYFYWDTQWKSLRRREKTACIVMRISMFFFYFRRLLITTGYEIKVHKRWPDFRVIFHERFTAAIRWKTPQHSVSTSSILIQL